MYAVGNLGHGKRIDTIDRPEFRRDSQVFVSISEYDSETGTIIPFVGDARMTVHNVASGEGTLTVWSEIEWDYDLTYVLNILIVNFYV